MASADSGWQRLAEKSIISRSGCDILESLWRCFFTFVSLQMVANCSKTRKFGNSASNLSVSKHLVHYERKVLTLERCLMTQDARECSTKLSFLDESVALLGDFFVQSVARTILTSCFMVLVCLC